MHTTTRRQNRAIARRAVVAGATLIVGAVVDSSHISAGSTDATAGTTFHETHHHEPDVGPRLLHGAIAEALVRVGGGAVCSGTPIAGTVYVFTAAHCVLDREGNAAARTVVRDGVTYSTSAVLVDDRYFDQQKAQLDAAVLVMDRVVPGPSATIGAALPTAGAVTIAGLQSLDSDGTLLRGSGPHDVLLPKGATGNLIRIDSAPAGCTVPTAALSITASRVDIPCGLIPGASGGGMFSEVDGTIVLVGIVSTVTFDLSFNGVVPLESLHELLRHPEKYRHEVTPTRAASDHAHVILS